MSQENHPIRVACLRKSDDYVYLAVKPGIKRWKDEYQELSADTEVVRKLEEGSQVYVYERETLSILYGLSRHESHEEFVQGLITGIGNVALDPEVESVWDKLDPNPPIDQLAGSVQPSLK